MIEALRSEDPQVQVAAARALGRAGTVAAVAALREAMPPHGDLLRSVGRQAIAEIQARLAGAEPGQLSLAGGEAGALSLADGEPGRLSLADDGSRRVSAPLGVDVEPDGRRPFANGPARASEPATAKGSGLESAHDRENASIQDLTPFQGTIQGTT